MEHLLKNKFTEPHSLKGSLLLFFLVIIFALSCGSLFLFVINFGVIQQYKKIADVMITEYRLLDSTSTLLRAYNTRLQSAGTEIANSEQIIKDSQVQISEHIAYLDKNIIGKKSQSNYLGLKANIDLFVSHINTSIEKFKQQNIAGYFDDYNRAFQLQGFVNDNGTNLFISELEYASSIRTQIDQRYLVTTVVGLFIIVFLSGMTIFLGINFVKKITDPLVTLASISQKIATGNMNIDIDSKILDRKDEIGILSTSFHTMTIALHSKITELERMNKLMVGREIKMTELKKELDVLKNK